MRVTAFASLSTQYLFGLDFVSDNTVDEVVETLLRCSAGPLDRWISVVTPNVDHLVRYERYPAERAAGQAAEIVLPDGAPIVWASRLLGADLARRLTGSDLFSHLWPRLADRGGSVVAIVGSERVAELLRHEVPAAALIVPPMFDAADSTALAELADQIVEHADRVRTEFVVIGVSMPKHHALAAELMSRPVPACGAPILLLLGASAEFHVGAQQRAPQWMQRVGLEWLHRLLKNPRGMAKRYLVDDVMFVRTVWREYGVRRRLKR